MRHKALAGAVREGEATNGSRGVTGQLEMVSRGKVGENGVEKNGIWSHS